MVILDRTDLKEGAILRVKRRNIFLCFATMLTTVWLYTGCNDENPTGAASDIVFPPNNVSYAQHVQPLFNQACALSGCHDGGLHDSPLCLDMHFNTVFRTPGVVIPGRPDLSTLVFRIEGTSGVRMPPTGQPLNQNQINGIRAWIFEGAADN